MPGTDRTPGTDTDRPADQQVILLEPGYLPATVDGRLVAVPMTLDHEDASCVPALVDGQAVAVPVYDPIAALKEASARLTAATTARPTPPAPAAADQGLPLAVRQYVLYGSIASLAASGAVWMLGAAVAEVAPHSAELSGLIKWASILVGLVVLGVAGLLGKLRSLTAGVSGAGASANAGGDGASATGTVVALVHRTHTTTIGRQSAGWRGSITNHNG